MGTSRHLLCSSLTTQDIGGEPQKSSEFLTTYQPIKPKAPGIRASVIEYFLRSRQRVTYASQKIQFHVVDHGKPATLVPFH